MSSRTSIAKRIFISGSLALAGVVAAPAGLSIVSAVPSISPATQTATATVGTAGTVMTTYTDDEFTHPSFLIVPSLPVCVSFYATTGVESGMPTAPSSRIMDTVTASDNVVVATAMLTLTVTQSTSSSPTPQVVMACVGTAITPTRSFSDTDFGGVKEFSISPALSAGLVPNTVTGIISRTPTVAPAAATHTISAQDGSVSATATVAVTIAGIAVTKTYVPAATRTCPAVNIPGRSIINVNTPQANLPVTPT